MKQFHVILQQLIAAEIIINYGDIGSRYIRILIVEDNKIKSIGCFNYSLWQTYSADSDTIPMLKELGKAAEEYRTGKRKKEPCLCFHSDKLKVIDDDAFDRTADELNKDFINRKGIVSSVILFPNGNIAAFDEQDNQIPFLQNKSYSLVKDKIDKIDLYTTPETKWIGFERFLNLTKYAKKP